MATEANKPAVKAKRVRRPVQTAVVDEVNSEEVADVVKAPRRMSAAPSVTAVMETAAPLKRFSRVRRHDITLFLRQLIMLLEAGTPLLKSLKTLAARLDGAGIRGIVSDIAQHVENGNALWQAFERHPHSYFDTVFVNLVKASEASGTLVEVLKRQTEYYERRDMLRRRIASALVYPAILVALCAAVLVLMAKFVVPAFKEIFEQSLDKSLPQFTQTLVGTIEFLVSWKMVGLIAILAGLYVAYRFWCRSPLNRLRADRWKLRVPLFGKVSQKYAIAQMTGALSMLLRSGMSMMVTLDLVRSAIHNQAVANCLQTIRDSVERGGGLEEPLRACAPIIPPVVADMLVTGEESGQLEKIADHIAVTYEDEVKLDIDTITDLLPPVLVVCLGVVVLMLVLGFFLPLISALGDLGTPS